MCYMNNIIPNSKHVFGEHILLCPVCGDHCVHPIAVECRSPGGEKGHVKIDADGIFHDPTQPAIGRGVMITLKFECECSHAFEYELHFHKGSTSIKRRQRSLPEEHVPATIWRN